MSSEVPAGEGSMAAVIGLDKETILNAIRDIDGVWCANFNCPGQIIITGKKEAVAQAMPRCTEAGALKVVELNVSGPFHSPLLKGAGDKLDKAQIKDLLKAQVSSPVMWEQTLYELEKMGVDTIIEAGPGRTIAGFVRKTVSNIRVIGVSTPEDIDKLLEKIG